MDLLQGKGTTNHCSVNLLIYFLQFSPRESLMSVLSMAFLTIWWSVSRIFSPSSWHICALSSKDPIVHLFDLQPKKVTQLAHHLKFFCYGFHKTCSALYCQILYHQRNIKLWEFLFLAPEWIRYHRLNLFWNKPW